MNVSFSVAMMLQAVNNMGPGIQNAIHDIQKVEQTARRVANNTRNLKPFANWDQGLKQTIETLDKLDKKASEISKKGSELQKSGFENMLEGAAVGLPIFNLVQKAGDRQAAQMVLMDSGMNRDEVAAITEQAKKLSSELMFSTNELLAIPLAMNRAGMDAEKIQNSFKQISYVTELEHMRTGRSSYDIAKDLSSMSELAQVTNDEGKLKGFMDTVNRIATITTANTGVLAESMKYFAPIAGTYGVTPTDMMMAQGIGARFGIEGSMAGTHLKDFLDRLNPEGARPQQLAAMYNLGFLENPVMQQTKKGMKVMGGQSVFFADGKAKSMLDIFGIFADKYKQMVAEDPQNGSLKFAGYMRKMLGEQGKDIGMIVAQNADKIQKMQADYQKVLTVEEGVRNFQTTFKQTFGAFISNIENIGVDAVTQLMNDLTSGMKAISPYVEAVGKWVESHQELVTWILKTALAVSALLIGLGATKIILGTVLKLIAGGFKFGLAPVKGVLSLLSSLMSLKTFFSVLRLEGNGFWSSLGKGAQAAFPWLAKISALMKGLVLKPVSWVFKPALNLVGWIAGNARMLATWIATNTKIVATWVATNARLAGIWLVTHVKMAAIALASCARTLATWVATNTKIVATWVATNARLAGIWLVTHAKMAAIALASCARTLATWVATQAKMVGTWLVNAARIAAGWLIAMGPVGWIILGVTAIIAAGIWAWKTNFMGFKDKCIWVWNAISSWAQSTWAKITGFVQGGIDKVMGYIDRVKDALGLSQKIQFNGPIQGATLATGNYSFMPPDSGDVHGPDSPFVLQSYTGNHQITIKQTNNVKVESAQEAGEYVGSALPEKYTRSRNPVPVV